MHRSLLCLAAASVVLAQAPAAKPHYAPPAATQTAMTDEQKTIYAIGLSIARSLSPLELTSDELTVLKQALSDAAAGKPAVTLEEWGPKINALSQERSARAAEKFLARAAAEPGAVKTDSGMIFRDITPGTGPSPAPADTVKVNYRGTLVDGTEFDSSFKRNEPASFPLNGVIPCWTEGVQKMKTGGKANLVCPANLAYGAEGRPGIPPNATLTFEIELLEVTPAGAPPVPGTPKPQS